MSGDSLYLEHYQEAKRILEDVAFEEQVLAIMDYAEHRIELGYVDDLTRIVTKVPAYYSNISLLNDEYKQSEHYHWWKKSDRYTELKFGTIKEQFMMRLDQKIVSAKAHYQSYVAKRKPQQEITEPLLFEGIDYLLVKYSDNYADEFDVNGFRIFTVQEWDTWQRQVPNKRIHAGFGTNEACEYRNKKDFLECFTVVPLTTEQAKTMFDLFGKEITKYLDYNGRNHDTIIHSTAVVYGVFPYHIGDKNSDSIDDLEDEDFDDEDFDDEE